MKLIRTMVERLGRGVVLKRTLEINGSRMPLLVSPDAQLKYLKFGKSAFDQDLIDIAKHNIKQGDAVWDIGANVGVFSFAAALMCKSGSVLAVEADTWLVGILRRTAAFDEYSDCDISVLPAAVAESNSVASFMVASRGRASNALTHAGGRSQMGGVRETQYVPTLTLDSLLEIFPAPNFVKVDIEGAELMALQGANKLVMEVRPRFYIEVGKNVSSQIFTLFQSARYNCIDPSNGEKISECVANTLFIPN